MDKLVHVAHLHGPGDMEKGEVFTLLDAHSSLLLAPTLPIGSPEAAQRPQAHVERVALLHHATLLLPIESRCAPPLLLWDQSVFFQPRVRAS